MIEHVLGVAVAVVFVVALVKGTLTLAVWLAFIAIIGWGVAAILL